MRFITTPEQDYLLSVLKVTRIMRKPQAIRLLNKLDDGRNDQYWERCLGQLGHIRKIAWLSDGLFTLPLLLRAAVDEDMLQAIDVMLDLTDIRILTLSSSTPPYNLCFLVEQKRDFGSYAITIVRPGTEAVISASLRDSGQDGRTVVFILSESSQAHGIWTTLPHFFAIPDGGGYRYFSK
jgi:hypothetical protein